MWTYVFCNPMSSNIYRFYRWLLDVSVRCRPSFWRREWDSNPRYGFPYTRFPSVRLKPLGHPSGMLQRRQYSHPRAQRPACAGRGRCMRDACRCARPGNRFLQFTQRTSPPRSRRSRRARRRARGSAGVPHEAEQRLRSAAGNSCAGAAPDRNAPRRAARNRARQRCATARVAMPQSARPERTAWAMSGPVGQAGCTTASASSASPARAISASSSSCAPAPGRPQRQPRALAPRRRHAAERSGLPGATSSPCSRRAKAITTASCRPGAAATASILASRHRRRAGADGSRRRRPRRAQAAAARLRCLPAGWPARSRSRATPIPAADRGCRRRSAAPARCASAAGADQARRQPAVERGLREQPLAGHLGAGHRAVRHQLIELALRQPQIAGRLFGGQQVRHMNRSCTDMHWLTKIDHFAVEMQHPAHARMRPCRTTFRRCNWCSPAIRRCSRSCGCRSSSASAAVVPRRPHRRAARRRHRAHALSRAARRSIVMLNALMGLPPVVVGLRSISCSRARARSGSWGLLFTPQAMIIAQTVLIAPIIAALTRQTIEDLWVEYRDELAAMDVGPLAPHRDADLGCALQPGHRAARRLRPRRRGSRRRHDRRRQYRRLHPHHDDRDRARDLEGRPAARDRARPGADRDRDRRSTRAAWGVRRAGERFAG